MIFIFLLQKSSGAPDGSIIQVLRILFSESTAFTSTLNKDARALYEDKQYTSFK